MGAHEHGAIDVPEAFCGDGFCNDGETYASCENDCDPPESFCGDLACNGGETCGTCSQDCSDCPPAVRKTYDAWRAQGVPPSMAT
ncbi:MAG: hypothetical protein R3C68_09030 [Myxococcota bacterium]